MLLPGNTGQLWEHHLDLFPPCHARPPQSALLFSHSQWGCSQPAKAALMGRKSGLENFLVLIQMFVLGILFYSLTGFELPVPTS